MFTYNKFPSRCLSFLVIILITSIACKTISPTPKDNQPITDDTSSTERPDLVISRGFAGMLLSGDCLTEYNPITAKICAKNLGDSASGSFLLQASEGTRWNVTGLAQNAEVCYETNFDLSGAMITVDAQNEIVESNEDNNTWIIPIPTPPVLCTPAVVDLPLAADIDYQGVSFNFDETLASSVTAETVPAEINAGIEVWNSPEHIQFLLEEYLLEDTFHQAHIMVFPVTEYQLINPTAAEIINQLMELLANKPTSPEIVPFLPVFNAGQFMQAHIKYLEYQGVYGVRFLTQYGQAAWPINNQDLFYSFQGLSLDGQYYISAIIPISHPSLDDPESVIMDDAFYENFADYSVDMELQLNAGPEDSFHPALPLLDLIFESLTISE